MKRRLLKLGLLVLAGAIINVAVAWGLALWRFDNPKNYIRDLPRQSDTQWWDQHVKGITGHPLLLSQGNDNAGFTWLFLTGADPAIMQVGFQKDRLREIRITQNQYQLDHAILIQSGWPARSLHGEEVRLGVTSTGPSPPQFLIADLNNPTFVFSTKKTFHYSSIAFPQPSSFARVSRFIPMGSVWPGFAINTILYAVIAWLLFTAPRSLRHWWRIKRGQCPACAYPVGTSDVCTECGKRVRITTA